MKLLIAIDLELVTKFTGISTAVAEFLPSLLSSQEAGKFTDAVLNHSFPTEKANEIVQALWENAKAESGIRNS